MLGAEGCADSTLRHKGWRLTFHCGGVVSGCGLEKVLKRASCSEDLSCFGWNTRGGVNGGDEGGKLEHLSSTRAVCEVQFLGLCRMLAN